MVAREPLPDGWKGIMRDRLTRVGAFLQRGDGLPPLFIVKMSQRVNVLQKPGQMMLDSGGQDLPE
jgi:hypothetical protein